MKALISVYDKKGVGEFAKELTKLGFSILSTGKTSKTLSEEGIEVTQISEYTETPEMFDGRVKTLHPKILGGVLADRKKHGDEMDKYGVEAINLVAVNLYPFRETVAKQDVTVEEAIENIDIGGVSLIRGAAKNFKNVIVIVEPEDYKYVVDALKAGNMDEDFRRELARKAFEHTAQYDALINHYFNELEGVEFPMTLNLSLEKIEDLRYGENKHQTGAAYRESYVKEDCVANMKQLHGKQLSYNNYLDLNDAFELVKDFDKPCAAVIKHTNPCGIAVRGTIEEAYRTAHEADPMSAFGSIVALNRKCSKEIAETIKGLFVEAVICPGFDREAFDILSSKKNIRLMETHGTKKSSEGLDMKRVAGGLVVQTREFPEVKKEGLEVKSARKASAQEIKDMIFAFKVCKHVKSNAIVFAKNEVAVGVGAGQMSRVDAVKIAAMKAGEKAKGAVMASDAFFPFRDGIDEAQKAGIAAVIQPGGSIRDEEVIDAVDEHGMAMVFTGVRVFRH